MSSIKKVALLGKGNLGSLVLKELLALGFEVTVMTRDHSSAVDLPDGVNVAEVDYSSAESLTKAFKGHDAVVSTIGMGVADIHKVVIDASVSAGVRRYIPNDYGALSTDPNANWLPFHHHISEVQDYIFAKAKSGELEYTIVSTGPWLEYLLKSPMGTGIASRKALLVDGGVHPFSTSTMVTVAKGIAGSLKNAEATKNRNVHVHDIITTLAKLYELGRKATPGEDWSEINIDGKADLQNGRDLLAKGEIGKANPMGLLIAAVFSGEYCSVYKSVDNEMLGLGFMTEEELDAKVASYA